MRPKLGEKSEGAGGTFGGLAPCNTATSQELRDCTHPKAHNFKEEWERIPMQNGVIRTGRRDPPLHLCVLEQCLQV